MAHADLRVAVRPTVRPARGFTLIELLTVIAIIALLIAILMPSLSKARDAAKNVRTRGTMKSISDGLELFVGENEDECHGNNYPSSRAGDDPTEQDAGVDTSTLGNEQIFGAQWLVRYLMGKNLDGYVPKRSVPKIWDETVGGPAGWGQKLWYGKPGDDGWPTQLTEPLARSGPYMGQATVRPPRDLAGSPVDDSTGGAPKWVNWVFVDAYNLPILYYAANSRYADRPNATLTTWDSDPNSGCPPGIYSWRDNSLFTGMTAEGTSADKSDLPPWDFGGGPHKLTFGPTGWKSGATAPTSQHDEIKSHTQSFAYWIMNKQVFETTYGLNGASKANVVPARRDSFLLWSPGKDGLFGTGDDITNF